MIGLLVLLSFLVGVRESVSLSFAGRGGVAFWARVRIQVV